MKLLSSSTRANMSSDRIVSEFIIRQAQKKIWGEKSANTQSSGKLAITIASNSNQHEDEEDLIDLLSKESEEIEVSSSDDVVLLSDINDICWFPVPCARTLRNHKRNFGDLPGFWNWIYPIVSDPKEIPCEQGEQAFEESTYFFS